MTRARLPRVRLAGVAVRGDQILLVQHQRAGREYYLLPGGGLEWGERCEAGLAREFQEELSLNISVGRLLFISESLEPRGRRHILNLTYHVKIRGGTFCLHADRRLKDARWVTRRELSRLTFYPEIRKPLLLAWKNRFQDGIKTIDTPWN